MRHIGITHYTASAHAEVERWLKTKQYDFVQINYSLGERDADSRLLGVAGEQGTRVIINRPFAEGALFRRVKGKALPPWAAELGVASWAQYFLKWIVGHPAVTCAIPATSQLAHLQDNLKAGDGPLPDETLREWKAQARVRHVGITHYTASAHRELERWLKTKQYDFVQVNYSLEERDAEERLLPLARELGVAVLVNRPFATGGMFRRTRGKPLPPWAAELGIASWAQYFLKWIVAHPAVTCVIPATSKAAHMRDNAGAGTGALPDAAMRERMAQHYGAL